MGCANGCGLIHEICRLKTKAGKLWNRAQLLVSRKSEWFTCFKCFGVLLRYIMVVNYFIEWLVMHKKNYLFYINQLSFYMNFVNKLNNWRFY